MYHTVAHAIMQSGTSNVAAVRDFSLRPLQKTGVRLDQQDVVIVAPNTERLVLDLYTVPDHLLRGAASCR